MSKSNQNTAVVEMNPLMSVPSQQPTAPATTTEPKQSRISKDGLELSKLMDEYKTKSAVIRFLNAKGYTRGEISEFTGIIYQHVRNVLVQDALKAKQAAASTTTA